MTARTTKPLPAVAAFAELPRGASTAGYGGADFIVAMRADI